MLKCFRFYAKGNNYFIVTDKVKRNKEDAVKILNMFTAKNEIQLKDYTEKIIENTLKTIQTQMELVEIKINGDKLNFHNKYGGGCNYKIIKYNVGKFYITE